MKRFFLFIGRAFVSKIGQRKYLIRYSKVSNPWSCCMFHFLPSLSTSFIWVSYNIYLFSRKMNHVPLDLQDDLHPLISLSWQREYVSYVSSKRSSICWIIHIPFSCWIVKLESVLLCFAVVFCLGCWGLSSPLNLQGSNCMVNLQGWRGNASREIFLYDEWRDCPYYIFDFVMLLGFL